MGLVSRPQGCGPAGGFHIVETNGQHRAAIAVNIEGAIELFTHHFNEVQAFFADRLEEGKAQSAELIRRLMTE